MGDIIPPHIDHTDYPRPFSTLSLLSDAPMLFGSVMEPLGRAVQVDPMKLKLKPPGTKRLKLKCGILLSTSARNRIAPLQLGNGSFRAPFSAVLPRRSLLVLQGRGVHSSALELNLSNSRTHS